MEAASIVGPVKLAVPVGEKVAVEGLWNPLKESGFAATPGAEDLISPPILTWCLCDMVGDLVLSVLVLGSAAFCAFAF